MQSARYLPLIDDSRSRRVAELLVVVFILSLADLVFTIWAQLFTKFYELNPLARNMIHGHGLLSLVIMKVTLTGLGAAIFWRLRKFGRAEIGLWIVVAAYVMLTFRWNAYTADEMLAMVR